MEHNASHVLVLTCFGSVLLLEKIDMIVRLQNTLFLVLPRR
jgi:hypothetical protein